MKKLYRRGLLYVTQTKIFRWLLSSVVPYIRFTTYYPKFSGRQYRNAYHLLSLGDILLCSDNRKLTTKLIGGELTHAALCVGKGDLVMWETLDMTHEDCRRGQFFDICKESDRVVILRCTDWDSAYISKVITKAQDFYDWGIQYDYSFKLGVKALYCSELVYEADVERRLKVKLDDVAGLGIPYISPTGLYNAENVKVIYDSKNDPDLTDEMTAREVMEKQNEKLLR